MKKQFLFLSFFFIGFCFSLAGQTDSAKNVKFLAIEKKSNILDKPNALFCAPLNLLHFRFPCVQIGYERIVTKKVSIQVEGGIILKKSIFFDMSKDTSYRHTYSNKGFLVRGSVKYFFMDKKYFKMYISPELFYIKNRSLIGRDFDKFDPDFEYPDYIPKEAFHYWNIFYNDEQKMGVNVKVGFKIFCGKYIFIEPHFGLGLAYRIVVQTGRINPNDSLSRTYFFQIFDRSYPNKIALTLPFNVKFGVRL